METFVAADHVPEQQKQAGYSIYFFALVAAAFLGFDVLVRLFFQAERSLFGPAQVAGGLCAMALMCWLTLDDSRRRLERARNLRVIVTDDKLERFNGAWSEEIRFSQVSSHIVSREGRRVIGQTLKVGGKAYDLSNLERQDELAAFLSERLPGELATPQTNMAVWMKAAFVLLTLIASAFLFVWVKGQSWEVFLSNLVPGPVMFIFGVLTLLAPGTSDGVTKRRRSEQLAGGFFLFLGLSNLLF